MLCYATYYLFTYFVYSRVKDPGGAGAAAGKKGPMRGKRDFTPVAWDQYFERMSDLKIANDVSFICILCHY